MKTALLLGVISFYSNVYTQEQTIHAILNKGLLNEHYLLSNSPTAPTIRWQHHYRLKDNLLSIRFTKIDTLTQCHCTVYRLVALDKIKGIAKDSNIIFLTETDAVKEVLNYQQCIADISTPRTETVYSDLFFTEIKIQKNNKEFGLQLQEAFFQNGFKIELSYWYD